VARVLPGPVVRPLAEQQVQLGPVRVYKCLVFDVRQCREQFQQPAAVTTDGRYTTGWPREKLQVKKVPDIQNQSQTNELKNTDNETEIFTSVVTYNGTKTPGRCSP